jgi:SAM-dependent methyltransferase
MTQRDGVATLEDVWPSPARVGLELIWAAQVTWAWTRAAEGGLAAIPGGSLQPIGPRRAEALLPAAVLSTSQAVLTNRGGVTLANRRQLQGAGLATSVDVAALRFFATSGLEDCEVSEAVLLAQPGDQVFGHQLLDLIPRVLTARRVLGPRVSFLISRLAVESFSRLLIQFGLQETQLVALPEDPGVAIRVPRLYLVTGARQDDKFDFERLEDMVSSLPRPPRSTIHGDLFLSRARLAKPQIDNRPLLNRTEVDDAFHRSGYRLVYPEEYSVADMAQLAQGARNLAGEDGSALHNVLWRPERLVCLGHAQSAVNLHLRLCDALGVDYVYLGGETAALVQETSLYPRDRSWFVPETWLREVLRAIQDPDCGSMPVTGVGLELARITSFAAEFIADEIETLEVAGHLVEAAVGHFDPKNPGVGDQFLAGAEIYAARYSGLQATTDKINHAAVRAGFDDFAPQLIFDAGCGPGGSVIAEARLFPDAKIVASDLSPNMVALLQRAIASEGIDHRVSPLVADASKIRLKPGKFDLILGSSMLHHLHDPFASLERLLSGLRPGGMAIFYEPFQAGNVILRQCLMEILRRLPEHRDEGVEPLEEVLKTFVLGLDLMFDDSRSHPVLAHVDDKWMFTRAQFEGVAARLGFDRPIITSMNPPAHTWEDKLKELLRSAGQDATERFPEWIVEVLVSSDRFISPELREELLMEGEIIFRRPT